jgi:hypothetical protein
LARKSKGGPGSAGGASQEKRVFGTSAPSAGKEPRASPDSFEDQRLRFRFDLVDEKHWQLHKIQTADHLKLLKRLKHFETLTVGDAKKSSILADYDMSKCPNKNAQRILQNTFEGQDSLARLLVEPSGALRLFGIREGNEIHVLWWDPKHDIWPEGKVVR